MTTTRAKTAAWSIAVFDGDAELNIANATLWFHATVGGVEIEKSSPSGGITIIDAALGEAIVQIDPADTEDIPQTGEYAGPCELVLQSGAAAYELNRGSITVLPNVSTP